MKLKSVFEGFIVAVGVLAGTAQATPLTWTWTVQGTIDNGVDQVGTFGTVGQELAGRQFSAIYTASVDPRKYATVDQLNYYTGMHGENGPDYQVSVTVNSVTLDDTVVRSGYGEQTAIDGQFWGMPNVYAFNSNQYGYDAHYNTVSIYSDVAIIPSRSVLSSNPSQVMLASTDNQTTNFRFGFVEATSLQTISFVSAHNTITIKGSNVPEPASIALMGLGFAGMAALRRRKKT